jgi:hypothetical protein
MAPGVEPTAESCSDILPRVLSSAIWRQDLFVFWFVCFYDFSIRIFNSAPQFALALAFNSPIRDNDIQLSRSLIKLSAFSSRQITWRCIKATKCLTLLSQLFSVNFESSFVRTYIHDQDSVARWYIFKPKMPIWMYFGVSCNERCW